MMDDKLKWILILGGGYLLYVWLRESTSAAAIPQPQQQTPQPQQQTQTPVTKPDDRVLMQAAVDPGKASLAGAFRMNWWAWNWYRMEGAKQILNIENPDPAVYQPPLDSKLQISPEQQLTAAEYHQLLHDYGLGMLMWRRV